MQSRTQRSNRNGPRTFDPVTLGHRECGAWVAYYRREWLRLLGNAFGMVRTGFGMNWARTMIGAWYVLRANQAWAPYPDNDPDAARAYMRRFYALVADSSDLRLDPDEASRREVDWWRVHRESQRDDALVDEQLVESLCDLYATVYGVDPDDLREAARHRVAAMALSDAWVDEGCHLASPLLARERRELVACYSALRMSVGDDQPRRSST
jgi:hypothetical protein